MAIEGKKKRVTNNIKWYTVRSFNKEFIDAIEFNDMWQKDSISLFYINNNQTQFL